MSENFFYHLHKFFSVIPYKRVVNASMNHLQVAFAVATIKVFATCRVKENQFFFVWLVCSSLASELV